MWEAATTRERETREWEMAKTNRQNKDTDRHWETEKEWEKQIETNKTDTESDNEEEKSERWELACVCVCVCVCVCERERERERGREREMERERENTEVNKRQGDRNRYLPSGNFEVLDGSHGLWHILFGKKVGQKLRLQHILQYHRHQTASYLFIINMQSPFKHTVHE